MAASEAVRVKGIRGAGDNPARKRNHRASKAYPSTRRALGGTGLHIGSERQRAVGQSVLKGNVILPLQRRSRVSVRML